ncbi:MAG: hypothetical protein JXB50_00090 [Spirochaetes bacterium]|nr:hypothetical protein [Spirochaetota bacterium]
MDNKVFQIDQECFLIYLENFGEKSKTFIKIGNSPAIKDFIDNIHIVNLLTKLAPGNPFIESKLIKSQKDKKIIGLKHDILQQVDFLKSENINIKKNESVIVEEANEIKNKKESEKEFIEEIKNDYKFKNHSFASFYKDGNIRIFTQNSLVFDLEEKLKEKKSEMSELNSLIKNYRDYYKNFYDKTGLIQSNDTLFAFSNNNFICLAYSSNWIKNALRVGIDPQKINFLFLAPNLPPSASWFKVLAEKQKNNLKTTIIFQKDDKNSNWIKLFNNDIIVPVFAKEELVEYKSDNFKLLFKNQIVNLINNKFKFFVTLKDSSPVNLKYIYGSYNENNFKLIIDNFEKGSYTLYNKQPLIISNKIEEKNYIYDFWNNADKNSTIDFKDEIKENDYDYSQNYKPKKLNNENFNNKLFIETVRRICIDGNNEIDDSTFNFYKNFLTEFNGNSLTQNDYIIMQTIGYDEKNKRVGIRDQLIKNSLINISDTINPLISFEKENSLELWDNKLNSYRNNYKKNIKNSNFDNKIMSRFNQIIEDKKFFKYEAERLSRFIKEKELEEKRTENKNNKEYVAMDQSYKVDKSKEYSNQYITSIEQEALTKKEAKKIKNKIKIPVLPLLLAFFLILLLLFGFLYVFRAIKIPKLDNLITKYLKIDLNKTFIASDNTADLTQDQFLKQNQDKYDTSQSSLKSKHYKFSMTILDHIKLVNEVAVKNGYHKMAPEYLKANLKGKDPDWIYPGNNFKMPNNEMVHVEGGNTLWGICEKYLINEINQHEIKIRSLIERTKKHEIDISKAKEEFKQIKTETHSQMMQDVIEALLKLNNFNSWEPYLDENVKH